MEQDYLNSIDFHSQIVEGYDDRDFYLTEDSLGLITYSGRYYTCIEAKLEDLKEYLVVP